MGTSDLELPIAGGKTPARSLTAGRSGLYTVHKSSDNLAR